MILGARETSSRPCPPHCFKPQEEISGTYCIMWIEQSFYDTVYDNLLPHACPPPYYICIYSE